MAAKKSNTNVTRISPSSLAIEPCDEVYVVMLDEKPVLTLAGDKLTHQRVDVLRHILDEFDGFGKIGVSEQRIVEPVVFSAFAIYGVQKEVIEGHRECLSLHFDKCLRGDGILYPSPGPNEEMAQQSRWIPVHQWVDDLGLRLPSLVQYWGDQVENPEEDDGVRDNRDAYLPTQHFVEAIEGIYRSMSAEQRATVYALHAAHNVVLFPMLLALGKCSVNEYASGVMAIHGVVAEDWAVMSVPDGEHSETFRQYRDVARVASEWLGLFRPLTREPSREERVLAEIQDGESLKREFKSSIRWHIHKKSHDEVITHACLKTIAAFLNSDDGGVLLIGVEDSGEICGIEHDSFPNDDKFLLHLYNYIQEWLGNQHATRVKTDLIPVKGKKVCRVECQPFAGDWAYLRRKGEEEFLVRIGPSSKPLKPSEIATYMASRKTS
jgi:hypothetical protein